MKPELIEAVSELLGVLVWPVIVLTLLWMFRKQIGKLIDRIQNFQAGPTGVNIIAYEKSIDEAKEIEKEHLPLEDAAKQFLEKKILEPREFRILRNLIDESEGLEFNSFKRNEYYYPALYSLIRKSLIKEENNTYYFTSLGKEVVKLHVVKSLGLKTDE